MSPEKKWIVVFVTLWIFSAALYWYLPVRADIPYNYRLLAALGLAGVGGLACLAEIWRWSRMRREFQIRFNLRAPKSWKEVGYLNQIIPEVQGLLIAQYNSYSRAFDDPASDTKPLWLQYDSDLYLAEKFWIKIDATKLYFQALASR